MSADAIYAFVMVSEDPDYEYAEVADPTPNDPTAHAISGINSAAFPEQFAAIAQISQSGRGPAVEQFYESTYCTANVLALGVSIAERLVDAEVNEGQGTGVKALQQAVNALGGSLTVDGDFGPLTLAASLAADQSALVPWFMVKRIGAYAGLTSLSAGMLREYIARASR